MVFMELFVLQLLCRCCMAVVRIRRCHRRHNRRTRSPIRSTRGYLGCERGVLRELAKLLLLLSHVERRSLYLIVAVLDRSQGLEGRRGSLHRSLHPSPKLRIRAPQLVVVAHEFRLGGQEPLVFPHQVLDAAGLLLR